MLQTSVNGLTGLEKALEAYGEQNRKALRDAIKGAAWRMADLMRREVSAGHAGGRRFDDLTMIGRYTRYGGKNTPLKGMAPAIRYWMERNDPPTALVGWTGPKISRTWRRYGRMHQEGFEVPILPGGRKAMIEQGMRMSKRSKYRKYFFLRKTTTKFKTPARPVIDPFWAAHRDDAERTVREFYRLKMAGKRWASGKLYRSGEIFGRISGHGR